MAFPLPDLEDELEVRLEEMGFELVEGRWVGSAKRPILRIRIDLPDSVPGEGGIGVDQCAKASRALEPWLDAHPDIPERYALEVSSPGVDRPLTKNRDFDRFRGQRVVVKGRGFPGEMGNRLEGELLGLESGDGGEAEISLLLDNGERIRIPLDRIQKAHLMYRWDR